MGDLIQLFSQVKNATGVTLDATHLAFSSISELRSIAWPFVASSSAEGGDQVVLRTFNTMAQMLLDPEATEQTAHAAGWGTLERQQLQGFKILALVNELWNESISIPREKS